MATSHFYYKKAMNLITSVLWSHNTMFSLYTSLRHNFQKKQKKTVPMG